MDDPADGLPVLWTSHSAILPVIRGLSSGSDRSRDRRALLEVTPATRGRAEGFIRGQVGTIRWPADPPDARPARRVGVGDRVFVYNFESREIDTRVVVGGEPDWDSGEVSRNSAIGRALFGAHEGEEREVRLPGQEPTRIRIVLIQGFNPGPASVR